MKQRVATVYVALDGRQFNTEAECLSYEENTLRDMRITELCEFVESKALVFPDESDIVQGYFGFGGYSDAVFVVQATEEIVNAIREYAHEVGEDCAVDDLEPDGTVLCIQGMAEGGTGLLIVNSLEYVLSETRRDLEFYDAILKDPTSFQRYQTYSREWYLTHQGKEFCGMEPACFKEWLDNEGKEEK